MNIVITYRNGESDVFEEKNLNLSVYTMKGHAANLIAAWLAQPSAICVMEPYNAVLLSEVISIRII